MSSSSPAAVFPSVRGTFEEARWPLGLLAALLLVLLPTLIFTPAGRLNWLLETGPGLIGIVVLDPFKPAPPKTPSAAELGVQPLDADREPTAGGPPAWLSNWALSGKRVGEEPEEESSS